jgi:polyisoprenoid-binding protein YceI
MSTSPTATSLPIPPGTWAIDKNHSGISFVIRHLGLSNVRGRFDRFDRFDATMVVGTSLDDIDITATVDLGSVDTNQPDRDAHLQSTDFFNAADHPTMTFASTAITEDDEAYSMMGDLTINGITRSVTFDVVFNGAEVFPGDQKLHSGFEATGELRRSDFGIDFNMPLGMGKLALGEKVKIEIDAQFIAP